MIICLILYGYSKDLSSKSFNAFMLLCVKVYEKRLMTAFSIVINLRNNKIALSDVLDYNNYK